MAQSKAKTSKRVTKPKQAAHMVPDAVRKPANQLLASLTGVMGKELLAEALDGKRSDRTSVGNRNRGHRSEKN